MAQNPGMRMKNSQVRTIASIVLLMCMAACDRIASAGIALSPKPTASVDSLLAADAAVFAFIETTASSHGLQPFDAGNQPDAWRRCLGQETLFICAKIISNEIHIRIWQWGGFSEQAKLLRRQLLTGLTTAFPDRVVRECQWKAARDARRSGCALIKYDRAH
jgi:hypothetical protein